MIRSKLLYVTSGLLVCTVVLFATGTSASSPQPSPEERAAMLKAWMAASEAQIRDYQWYTETIITVNGKKESDVKERCFYGPEGQVQKVSMGDSVDHSGGLPGLLPPGRIIKMVEEHKQKVMKETINNAITLLHSYIPPHSADIQSAIHAGELSVNMLDPGRKVELVFNDYKKTGDQLGVEIELPTNRLLGLTMKSYLDSPDDPVNADVTMAVMADGTIYPEKIVLNASEHDLEITVINSDYNLVK